MAPQDLTIEDLLADAQSSGATPAQTVEGLRRWRGDLLNFGRSKDPETYWKEATRLDQDLAPVLESLREQEGVRILRESLPEEQRPIFSKQYADAGGDPAQMNPAFKDVAARLNALSTDQNFALPTTPTILTLNTDDGKPIVDVIARGNEALIRPLKEGGKPFLVPLKQYTREELDALATEAEGRVAQAEEIEGRIGGIIPYSGPPSLIVDDVLQEESRKRVQARKEEAQLEAEIYRSGDPIALATLDVSKTLKSDPKLLEQVADKSLADRFQAGMLRAGVGTARAILDTGDLLTGNEHKEVFDKLDKLDEVLATTNEDTARSFRATTGDKVAAAAAESFGQMAPTLVPFGLATRAAGIRASELGAAASMAPSSYGNELGALMETAKAAEEAGDIAKATQLRSVARWSALAQAAIDTGTEMIFPESSALIRGGAGAAKRLATGVLKEGVEEVAAGTLERGLKEPAFYPEDMQAGSLGEGAMTEFAAGALGAAPIQGMVEGPRIVRDARQWNRERLAKAKEIALANAPDAGTANSTRKIFDAAAAWQTLDLPEEGSPQGVGDVTAPGVETPSPASLTERERYGPPTVPPAQPVEAVPTPLTTQESGAPPVAPAELPAPAAVAPPVEGSAETPPPVGDATTSLTEQESVVPPGVVTPLPPDAAAQPPVESAAPAAQTINPASEGSAPGGVVDLGASTEGPATGSSAPAVSEGQPAPVPTTVNDLATSNVTAPRNVDPAAFRARQQAAAVQQPQVDMQNLQQLAASNTIGEAGLRMELQAYTPEERAYIAQQLGTQDTSPAALAKALRFQEQGDTRFSLANEPTGGMTEAQARAALAGQVPSAVSFINDPTARTPWGKPWAGKADRATGRVQINLAFIQNAEDLKARVKEEMLHLVWQDPAVKAAVADLEAAVTPGMREEMARLGYEPGMQTEEAAARLVDKLTRTPDGRSAWRRLLDAIRNAFRRLFRMEPDAQQVQAAAHEVLRYAMSERPAPGQGTAYAQGEQQAPQTQTVTQATKLSPGVNVTLAARGPRGQEVQLTMDAEAAQAMLTKRKSVLEALLDCLNS